MITSKTERALLACGLMGRTCVVLATDGPCIASDVDNISEDADEIGLDTPDSSGLYLWEGRQNTSQTYEGDCDVTYDGTLRPVQPEEIAALLAMKPPEPEPLPELPTNEP